MDQRDYYWNHQYGRLTFNRGSVWCKVDGTWYGTFTDKIGTVVNLPLSEVCLYSFQDAFVVIDIFVVEVTPN